jgi:hypothetical protein
VGDYKGSHEDAIVLGTDAINNWEMLIRKKAKVSHQND